MRHRVSARGPTVTLKSDPLYNSLLTPSPLVSDFQVLASGNLRPKVTRSQLPTPLLLCGDPSDSVWTWTGTRQQTILKSLGFLCDSVRVVDVG